MSHAPIMWHILIYFHLQPRRPRRNLITQLFFYSSDSASKIGSSCTSKTLTNTFSSSVRSPLIRTQLSPLLYAKEPCNMPPSENGHSAGGKAISEATVAICQTLFFVSCLADFTMLTKATIIQYRSLQNSHFISSMTNNATLTIASNRTVQ